MRFISLYNKRENYYSKWKSSFRIKFSTLNLIEVAFFQFLILLQVLQDILAAAIPAGPAPMMVTSSTSINPLQRAQDLLNQDRYGETMG